jgi:hypothetical protein
LLAAFSWATLVRSSTTNSCSARRFRCELVTVVSLVLSSNWRSARAGHMHHNIHEMFASVT